MINDFRAEVVTGDRELRYALCIRAICFVQENGVPATQITDGNDFNATHFVFYAGDEPVGTLRARFFNGFVKFERMSIRQEYREKNYLRMALDFAFDHVSRKGYTKVITHAEKRFAVLWRRSYGFKPMPGKEPVLLDGHSEPYIELFKILDPHPDAITEATAGDILFRTEGHWDNPNGLTI